MTKKVNLMTDAGADVSTVNEAVSQRIKQYRKQKKMSLDELSRQANVSKGALVEIEGCKANPSIALLCRLAAAMGVSVADFVDVGTKPTVHLIAEGEIPELWKGDKGGRARLLAGSGGPDMTELWMWEMQPGEKFASPGHSTGTLELFYVQTGTLTLGVQEHLYLVNSGCSATARMDVPHFYENRGESPLIFIMTVNEKAS
ncbi:helix-turn-helix transcriptional regulator [Citrobacter werkmanii]|uniref:Helix-turn-helix transcriptional regulator n=1 Tax=Citrobacter werkmanii TaxID=67827 RepID=A0AA37Z8G6_9ENTR|nr:MULTISPECIES: helix-turn-helix transcriptional regulator [Citrobacter]MDN8550878.1 helix-turn-helix transcriptional regulator [Citrobacter werkmanii]MDT0637457.1 helix-turn-helix transcriptional regulator [Citrobacter werkmanii]MEC3944246.1 helix-turn-helix transcriptional regulator [Citrobacter werkmanii]TKU07515.1 helix-turn-helix transcriptional regulator [Citrobacter sp. TBCS-15]HAT7591037.1 helix-turn-helix transcriptional regulator [Citrobacter werkmanii]